MLCHGTVCVVGKMRDLILQLSKSSIYSTKPDDVSILSKEGYNKRWEHYTTNNVFDLIEEREVIC
ncbi:TPA: hypothetical protein GF137_21035 [Escherichia coli]|nr:hypothetical protein [Escherichia coli]